MSYPSCTHGWISDGAKCPDCAKIEELESLLRQADLERVEMMNANERLRSELAECEDDLASLRRQIEEEQERHAFDLSPAMVQARNDQLNAENESLRRENEIRGLLIAKRERRIGWLNRNRQTWIKTAREHIELARAEKAARDEAEWQLASWRDNANRWAAQLAESHGQLLASEASREALEVQKSTLWNAAGDACMWLEEVHRDQCKAETLNELIDNLRAALAKGAK